MFMHLFYYRLKSLLRKRDIIFWTMLFPILLSTLFKLAFGNITEIIEDYKTIPIGITIMNETDNNSRFLSVISEVMLSEDKPMFSIKYFSKEEGETQVEKGSIDGLILLDSDISVVFSQSSINQSIIRQFINRYLQHVQIYSDVLSENPSSLSQVLLVLEDKDSYLEEVSLGGEKADPMLQFFYALIAMTCLYGSFLGLLNSESIQANISALGARRHITPTNRATLIIADTLAAFLIHFLTVLLLCAYMRFILKVSIGTRPFFFLLTCLTGSIIGVSLGQFVGSVVRKNENLKMALTLGLSMILSFFSGLMYFEIKYIIEKNIPILNRINPAAMITDAFYSLTVYDDLKRYTQNLIGLIIIAVTLTSLSFLSTRRSKYASL